MNNVCLMGRLTKEVEVRYSQSATPIAVARYTLAVPKQFKKQGEPDADFINCICFGKTAEFAEKHLAKGKQIAVTGRIQTGSYEKDGRKIYTTDIVVDGHTFCGSADANNSNVSGGTGGGYMPQIPTEEEDDLPF